MKTLLVNALSLLANCVQVQVDSVGLRGDYYQGRFEKKAFTRTDQQISFHWSPQVWLHKGLETSHFSIRWTGQIYAPATTIYYFSAQTSDKVQVWVDKQLVLGDFSKLNQYKNGGSITLTEKRWYPIKVEYIHEGFIGDRRVRELVLYWETLLDRQGPIGEIGAFRKIIPARYLSPKVIIEPNKQLVTRSLVKPRRRSTNPTKPHITPLPIKQSLTIGQPADLPIVKPSVKLGKGEITILEQVQFEQSSYVLNELSFPTLNQLAYTLISGPSLRVEISGHTDNIGDVSSNVTLSEYRAHQVANYLIKRGVRADQLVINGYGSQRPITDNKDEAKRVRNRRVEIKIL